MPSTANFRKPTIFLSMVTSEFRWLREELRNMLTSVCNVRSQEDEAQAALDMLTTLQDRICDPTLGASNLLIHVVGEQLGSYPTESEWQHFYATVSTTRERRGEQVPFAKQTAITYTQFESHVAVWKGIPQLVYRYNPVETGSSQEGHLKFLHSKLGREATPYGDHGELRRQVVRDMVRFVADYFGHTSAETTQLMSEPALEFLRVENQYTKKSIEDFSTQLTEWPKEIPGAGWLERAELRTIQSRIEESGHSSTLLVGPPGSGKSALLSKLAEWGLEKNFAVLAIKSDMLPKEISSIEDLSRLVLGDKTNLVDRLRELSVFAPVLVLIDQLDALGSLSDLETGRLNAILDFIQDLVKGRSVHLVASVRNFELQADQRLSSLSNQETNIELACLDESQVRNALASNSIDSTNWPQAYIEFLRTPYHLSLFLRAFDPLSVEGDAIPEALLFSSIQAIHDHRWDQLMVGRTSDNSKVITDVLLGLGNKISDTEVLWHPRAAFGTLTDSVLSELKELGWLTQTGELLGFAHQTQYEFVLAKRFSSSPDAFFAYVWNRRDRLTVRPVVWHVLSYLRDRAFVGYVQVMGRLLAQIERRHLQRLLLEFLAEVPGPKPPEVNWLRGYLESERHYATVCWLLRSKRAWFQALPDECIIELMTWQLHNGWPVTRLLATTLHFTFDRTKNLLRSTWAFRSAYANHIVQILLEAEQFDEETVAWAHAACVDETVSSWASQQLIDRLTEIAPNAAPRILAAKLNSWLTSVLEKTPDTEPKREDFEKEKDFAVTNILHSRNNDDQLESLLDSDALFKVKELAKNVPSEFVRRIWPWFKEVVTHCSAHELRCFKQYRWEYPMQRWFGLHRSREYAFLAAMEHAIHFYAIQYPHEFIQLLIEERQLNSMTCQRLLAGGLTAIAHLVPDFVLHYYLSDVRNLLIGDENRALVSVRLFQATVGYWTPEQQEQFQDYVLHAELLADCETDIWQQQRVDYLRCRYLICLPLARRSATAQELIAKVLDESPNAFDPYEPLEEQEMTRIISSVAAKEMESMSTTQLLNSIRELPDNTGRDHPTDWRYGGSKELAEEFAKFAESNPTKAIEIIKGLKPGENEHVAGGGLRGLRKSKDHFNEIIALIQELVTKGFASSRFQNDVGQCVHQLAIDCQGLPANLCQVMETWLLSTRPSIESVDKPDNDEEKSATDDEPSAILWQYGGLYSLPNEYFWLGEAIKLGHCLASPPRYEAWYSFFERQSTVDFPLQVWEAWLWQLCRYVPSRQRVAPHIANLLERRSDIRSSLAGYRAFACFYLSMNDATRTGLLDRLAMSTSNNDQQVAGEIATYVGLPNGDDKSKQLIDIALANPTSNSHILTGIAFAAAELWTDQIEYHELSLNLFKGLFAGACPSTSAALMSIFNHDNCLDESPLSRELLELTITHLRFEKVREVWPLTRHLTKFMSHDPRLTLSVCQSIVKRIKSLGANETAYRLSLSEEPLVSIALTIHRSPDPELAAEALTLFEDLLDLQANDAFKKLRELDGRFTK